jgi:hypothetical protein
VKATDCARGALPEVGDVDGSIDIRSIRPRSRSRSRSACPLALAALSASIWPRSWAPSERRLFTKVSTFLSKLSTVSFISLYHCFALWRPATRSRNSWYIRLYFDMTEDRCRVMDSYLLCSALTLLSCNKALKVAVSSFISDDCL